MLPRSTMDSFINSLLEGCRSVGMATMDSCTNSLLKGRRSLGTFVVQNETQIIITFAWVMCCVGTTLAVIGVDIYQNKRLVSHSSSASNRADDTEQGVRKPRWLPLTSPRTYRKMMQSSMGGSAIAVGIALIAGSFYMSCRVALKLSDCRQLVTSSWSSADIATSATSNSTTEQCVTPTLAECYQTIAAHSHGMLVDLWKIVVGDSKK
mmetsp:Transcript_15944/g.39516  ORF Transcript_15944/g.39516 Transcript_15944/m.39516 type:complete len:208 (-) Transcript_15944:34-657(-)